MASAARSTRRTARAAGRACWAGSGSGAARLFADAEHGTPGAALDAALAWRDVQLDPRHHVPVPAVPIALAPGVYFAPDTVRGHTYAVIKASADDADGKRHSLNRSLLKHAPEAAIRDAAEMRFRLRQGLAGFDYESADALFHEALAAYRAHVAGNSALTASCPDAPEAGQPPRSMPSAAKPMGVLKLLILSLLLGGSACSQTPERQTDGSALEPSRPDLYRCEGCEVTTERSPQILSSRAVLPPEGELGEPLVLSGRVLQPDGETLASGVVLYFHQTNAAGLYRSRLSTARGGRGDGIIEGWLVTDAEGRYEVITVKPAPYPDAGIPAHVHVYVKEPERQPYYLDDFVFADDPHVTPLYRAEQELRGGSGILNLVRGSDGTWRGQRDIVLER